MIRKVDRTNRQDRQITETKCMENRSSKVPNLSHLGLIWPNLEPTRHPCGRPGEINGATGCFAWTLLVFTWLANHLMVGSRMKKYMYWLKNYFGRKWWWWCSYIKRQSQKCRQEFWWGKWNYYGGKNNTIFYPEIVELLRESRSLIARKAESGT